MINKQLTSIIKTFWHDCMMKLTINCHNRPFAPFSYNTNSDDHERRGQKYLYRMSHMNETYFKVLHFWCQEYFHTIILMVEKWRNRILKPKNEAIDLCNPYWTPCICTTTDLIKNQDENLRPVLKVLWENQVPKKDNFLLLFFLAYFWPLVCLEFTLITFVNNAWGLKICTFSKTVCP